MAGAFTIRVHCSRMTPEERAAFDEEWGVTFDD
jgi:hypothetical protein